MMNNKKFKLQHRVYLVLIALLVALSLSTALADGAVVNGSFGSPETGTPCNLNGWTTSGDVSVVNGTASGLSGADSCVARVSVTGYHISTLSQTFTVPVIDAENETLYISVWYNSTNDAYTLNGIAPPVNIRQNLTLYDANGSVVATWTAGTPTTQKTLLLFDWIRYSGQRLQLVATVAIDKPDSTAIHPAANLYIDDLRGGFRYEKHPPGDTTSGW